MPVLRAHLDVSGLSEKKEKRRKRENFPRLPIKSEKSKRCKVPTQKMPMAYWEIILKTTEETNAMTVTRIFCCASLAPLAAECMPRMVIAVAIDVGKTRLRSLATRCMKNLRTGFGVSID